MVLPSFWTLFPLVLVIIKNGAQGLGAESPATNPAPPSGRGYGEPCTCDRDCDLGQWLNCQEGSCLCLSTSFQYDHSRASCVVRLGQKCFEVAPGSKYGDLLPPFIRCVEGAFCSLREGGLCACNGYGYYQVPNGDRCEQRKPFGGICSLPVECTTDACSDGICSCREGQYYDNGRDKCLGVVGSFCFSDADCTPNAICSQSAKCSCGLGFSTPHSSGDNLLHCVPQLRLGDNCSSSSPCNNPALACFNAKCTCAYPGHQLVQDQSCKSLVASAPCVVDTDCVSGARCSQEDASECRCLPNHVEMEDGSCQQFKTFGVPCSQDEECDPVTPLLCKDAICQCSDSMTSFDPEARLCRGLHGYRGCIGDKTCTQFANCVQYNEKLPPKCACRSPQYKPGGNRTCIPA